MRQFEAGTVSQKQTGVMNDIIRYRFTYGAVNTGTTSIIAATKFYAFKKGVGETDTNLSTGALITLQPCDTNLISTNGIIPNAERFTIYGIGVDAHLASISATTPFSDNTVTAGSGTINVNPLAVANCYPLIDFIRSMATFKLIRNSFQVLEYGNIADYPCGLYASGWGSNGQASVPAVTTGPVQAAYTQNGFMTAQNGATFRKLTVAQILEANDQFQGEFEICRPATLTGTGLVGYVDFLLVGELELNKDNTQGLMSMNGFI